jgi:hypothetical protein
MVIGLGWLRILARWLRGSKGGPKGGHRGSDTADMRWDHHDMTPRRRVFEYLNKFAGYLVILLATADVALGLRAAARPDLDHLPHRGHLGGRGCAVCVVAVEGLLPRHLSSHLGTGPRTSGQSHITHWMGHPARAPGHTNTSEARGN